MADFPALPLWTDAYMADTMHLTLEEHGAYLKLLMIAWRSTECSLPDNNKRIAQMLATSERRWKEKLRPIIAPFWTIYDGKWTQKRLLRERKFQEKIRERNARAADARWLKEKGSGYAGASPTHPPIKDTTSVPKQYQNDAPSPSPIKKKEGDIKNVSQERYFPETKFNYFWSLVPRKVGKGNARRAYNTALKKTEYKALNAGIVRYAREVAGKDDEFIAHPATWLNGERWLDEPERKTHGNQHRGNGAKRPSAHDTMLAAHAFAAASRPDTGKAENNDPDGRGKGDADKPPPGVPRLPSARRTD